jgi:hypothetical protein
VSLQAKQYSSFSDPAWRAFKKVTKERDEDTFIKWWHAVVQSAKPGACQHGVLDTELTWAQCACVFLWNYRPIEHYFLAEGLGEFLASSVPDFTRDYCRKLPCSERTPEQAEDHFKNGIHWKELDETGAFRLHTKDKPVAFALHFPFKERQRSIVVFPDATMAMRVPKFDKWSVAKWFFVATDGEDICCMQIEPGALGDGDWISRVIFGFSLYIEAFPETVVSAGVGEIHKINHYTGARNSVACNEVVKSENERAATSPHFRRGHFRVLHSERYTKKRGHVVFVKGCFVRGHAYEVLEDAA